MDTFFCLFNTLTNMLWFSCTVILPCLTVCWNHLLLHVYINILDHPVYASIIPELKLCHLICFILLLYRWFYHIVFNTLQIWTARRKLQTYPHLKKWWQKLGHKKWVPMSKTKQVKFWSIFHHVHIGISYLFHGHNLLMYFVDISVSNWRFSNKLAN